jgi:glycosyltransferase involved in cell wall biosynthesis
MLKFYEFARLAGRIGKCLDRPDVIFATHTPLPIGLAGISLSRHFDVPFVFEVRDLWPEGLVDLGVLKNPVAIWWLRRLAKKIYVAADHIVALAPGMKDGIMRAGIRSDQITVIPNCSDLDVFRPDLDGSRWRERLGLADQFTAIYFGAMGPANGLKYVIEAARILAQRGRDDIVIILQGDGAERAGLEEMARHYKLENMVFQDPVPKDEIAQAVAGCQVCMTILRPSKHNAWSPNKMFDALAAGKPVLINVPGWLGETIENNDCGRCLDPYRPEALANALEELSADPELCRKMGKNGRELGEREFDRRKLAGRLERVLVQVVKRS